VSERCIRVSCRGEQLLGILHLPSLQHCPGPYDRAVLILVGGPQYRVGSHRQFVLTARHLAAAGFPVLRFDFRGMGDSTGDFQGFEHVGDDVRAALDALFMELPGLKSVSVFGLCDAASAALIHCTADARVDSLLLANPWVRTEAGQAAVVVKHYYGQRLLQKSFWLKMFSGGLNPFAALSGLLNSWRTSRMTSKLGDRNYIDSMLEGLQRFSRPVLFLVSDRDLTAREFDGLCESNGDWRQLLSRSGVQRVRLANTDHTFSDRRGLVAALAAITDFLRRL
jgi:exosortase A-associated hydrolase 1